MWHGLRATLPRTINRTLGICLLASLLVAGACADEATNEETGSNNVTANSGTGGGGTTANSATGGGGTTANSGTGGGGTTGCQPLSPAVGNGTCDSLCQTGCGEGQNACVTAQSAANGPVESQCVPAGTATQGGACGQEAACAAGFGCFSTDGTSASCMKFCRLGSQTAPQCDGNNVCVQYIQGETRLGICITPQNSCTDFPDSCGAGQNCYPTSAGTQCVAYKADAQLGDACTMANACNNGHRCINGRCLAQCDPASPNCAQGEQCAGITYPDGTAAAWGVCASNG